MLGFYLSFELEINKNKIHFRGELYGKFCLEIEVLFIKKKSSCSEKKEVYEKWFHLIAKLTPDSFGYYGERLERRKLVYPENAERLEQWWLRHSTSSQLLQQSLPIYHFATHLDFLFCLATRSRISFRVSEKNPDSGALHHLLQWLLRHRAAKPNLSLSFSSVWVTFVGAQQLKASSEISSKREASTPNSSLIPPEPSIITRCDQSLSLPEKRTKHDFDCAFFEGEYGRSKDEKCCETAWSWDNIII